MGHLARRNRSDVTSDSYGKCEDQLGDISSIRARFGANFDSALEESLLIDLVDSNSLLADGDQVWATCNVICSQKRLSNQKCRGLVTSFCRPLSPG